MSNESFSKRLWDGIRKYVEACGGRTEGASLPKMEAVAEIGQALSDERSKSDSAALDLANSFTKWANEEKNLLWRKYLEAVQVIKAVEEITSDGGDHLDRQGVQNIRDVIEAFSRVNPSSIRSEIPIIGARLEGAVLCRSCLASKGALHSGWQHGSIWALGYKGSSSWDEVCHSCNKTLQDSWDSVSETGSVLDPIVGQCSYCGKSGWWMITCGNCDGDLTDQQQERAVEFLKPASHFHRTEPISSEESK